MKNKIFNCFSICVLFISLFNACSKSLVDASPQTCFLSNIANLKGNVLERMSYDANNRLIGVTNDSSGIAIGFSYNAQNVVDKINLVYKVGTNTYNFLVTFTYDAAGKATKSVTTVNGTVYQNDVFSFTGNQLTGIISTDNQGDTYTSRFQYTGDNVAKVYLKYNDEQEFLFYEVTKFDNKKNVYPEVYKYLTMGLSGLLDDYAYFNKNNVLAEKYYDEDGVAFFRIDNTFEYNSSSQPSKITSLIDDDGDISTVAELYQYSCK